MSIDSISGHAQACRERAYLTRWFPANIIANGEQYSFGETELAVIEETLRYLDREQSLFVHDPIPSNRISLGICLAYVRTQDPRFPDDGIVGGGKTLLGFPALHHGYVSMIDEFREDGIGQGPRLVHREPIDRLSQTRVEADMHTAKNNFEFDQERPEDSVGAVFVDLRKPEWGNVARRFDAIMKLYEACDCPFVFYTDEMTTAAETVVEEMDAIHVTNELLTTADPTTLPKNPSLTTRFEHLINTADVTVEQITIGYPDMYRIMSDLSAMRNDIQASQRVQGVIKMEVGWLFNLLTRLPVKPEYWDAVVAGNFYQQGVRELLDNLRGKAQRLDGRAADVLINYCEAANALHGKLNTHHPLQDTLFELITTADESSSDSQRIVVVRNEFERKAILRALTLEEYELAPNVSIRTVDDVEPTSSSEIIVARPLDSDSYLYDFPLAERIAFLQFESWAPIVEDRLEDGMARIGATVHRQEIGEVGGRNEPQAGGQSRSTQPPAEAYERPEDTATEDPTETLREDFESGESTSGSGSGSGGEARSQNPDLEVTLSNDETRQLSAKSRVSVLKDNGDIGRKLAEDLTDGETLLLLDTTADDIYDLFVESAHQKDRLRKAESVVDRWRSILVDGLSADMTEEKLLEALQEHGSDISDVSTISNWRTGGAIGPQDPENVRRVLTVLEPEMEPTYEATVAAMKRIRKEHRAIGRRARGAIEAQMSSSITGDLTTDLPDDADQVSKDVRKATVEAITSLNK